MGPCLLPWSARDDGSQLINQGLHPGERGGVKTLILLSWGNSPLQDGELTDHLGRALGGRVRCGSAGVQGAVVAVVAGNRDRLAEG